MREEFLHYLWKYKKFQFSQLTTVQGESIVISKVGEHNFNSGPDFFNALIKVGGQLWAGNVEIHVKSSDWYLHNHENDIAYDNVVLHVVWEHDTQIFRKDNSELATLILKDYTDIRTIENYNDLFSNERRWIHCEPFFADMKRFDLQHWLERLYFERLERKSKTIESLLEDSKNDWEAILFIMLAKNFGLKVNGHAFYTLANSIDYSVVRKSQNNIEQLEALFFGQAGLLDKDIQNGYYQELKKEYQFLRQKFQLANISVASVQFFRLRPPNFPTIRLSQLASLYHNQNTLFSKIIETNTLEAFYDLFKVSTSKFWETHYTFEKSSKASVKTLTHSFIDLVLINTVLPIKFLYAKQHRNESEDSVLQIANKIASENNSIVQAFNNLKKVSESALQSQALIQLKTEYCDKSKCLQCVVGNKFIGKIAK
ncbi:DUF2851 family protein [Aestuariibaculum sediminum]|uniref:DUF2851 family protein n=1 Tax=Aestuariibaculum sediminum TaxID=2770637 RepID=A0A8J6U6I6_9FLAO|nr:DUF2851 family protein [Aestuariibaculum sediminum]MBD0830533.1 DUF2851 family protein [Aestuariibaculum sediminum]